jgi:D-glycero-D-manno-heptose 1,7-bisphosphate phosphatase
MNIVESLREALFLCRDGVIKVEKNYVYRIEDFEFIHVIIEFCALAPRLDYRLVVITNHADTAFGFFSEADYQPLPDWMLGELHSRASRSSAPITVPIAQLRASANTGRIPSIASRIRA